MNKSLALVAGLAALTSAVPANALIVSLVGTLPVPGGTSFIYAATADLNESVKIGSQAVIFDFQGYVPGSIFSPFINVETSTEFTSSLQPLSGSGFVDDPGIINLVFTYVGPPMEISGATFNGFTATSTFSGVMPGAFSALTVKTTDGSDFGSQGSVGVPMGAMSPVPEPTAWVMMMLGFGMVGVGMRRRRTFATA